MDANTITCIERRYKVESENLTYFITAKKELNQDITDLLLREDMELKTFLEYYQIEDIQEKERVEETMEKVPEKQIELAKLPTPIQREWIILHHMPEEFSLKDIVKFYIDKEEWYDEMKLKSRYSSTLQKLKKQGHVEIVNPQDNRAKRRYRKSPDYTERTLKNLKEGKKVLMGTIL
jgi:hypothetical protein